jgi:hypothetical protein
MLLPGSGTRLAAGRFDSRMRTRPTPIEPELAEERAAALGRSGRRLRVALERVREFDDRRAGERPAEQGGAVRDGLVDTAAEAFWCYIVQRESLGLTDTGQVAADYGVSREILTRVGICRRK